MAKNTVAIAGEGWIADTAARELADSCHVVRVRDAEGVPADAALCLVLGDRWRPSAFAEAENTLRHAGVPWIGGYADYDEGVVGPLVRPGGRGCSQCAATRRQAVGGARGYAAERLISLWRHGVSERAKTASGAGLRLAGLLAATEARRVLRGELGRTEGRMYRVDLGTQAVTMHAFLPDPACPVCGGTQASAAEEGQMTLRPSPKASPDSFRTRRAAELAPAAAALCLDPWAGMLNEEAKNTEAPFADVVVSQPFVNGTEWSAGRSHRYGASRFTAIMEGLERYCGSLPRGRRETVHDSWRNLRDAALHPASAGLYSEEQYADPEFPFEPFDEEAVIPWVWGYSLTGDRPVLVPQALGYYGGGFGGTFVDEGSNGSAIGGSLEEAILHGMLEIMERDAFLLTWYGRLPVPRLDPASLQDRETRLMIERLQAVAGYDLSLFDITMEHGIPCIWAMIKNRKAAGANVLCAAGCHLDPVRAAQSAVFELAGRVADVSRMYEADPAASQRMLEEPEETAEMPDHALLYANPHAEARLDFLLGAPERPLLRFQDAFAKGPDYPDLTRHLTDLLAVFRRLGIDVIAVDQTAPELSPLGLRCVKVIMPGMLPMSFGHRLRRLEGLERLKRVPVLLGYRNSPLTDGEINPHPHPFL